MKLALALFAAACSGFIALSYEIVWYRVLSMMMGGIAATFGLLLAAYLFGLAIGSRASARFCRDAGGDPRQLALVAAFIVVANLLSALVTPAFGWSARFTDLRIGLTLVAIAAAFQGAVLPLVTHFALEPDDRVGTRLSYVYLANILGSAAGSLITGFVLMDRFALPVIAQMLVVAGALVALPLVLSAARNARRAAIGAAVIALSAALAASLIPTLHHRLYERLVYASEYDGSQEFAMVVENKSGVITVSKTGSVYGGGSYEGVVNPWLDANDKNGIHRAYTIGAIHAAPREVLMVGLASGSWAQVVAHLDGVERLTIIEINPGYREVVARYPEVASLLRNPKVDIVIDDGRRWLQRHPRRFDLIVMNTMLHWRAHATNLLSTEFLTIAREHLKDGGILFFNTTKSEDAQLTAAVAFPHLMRIANFVAVSDTPFQFDRARWKTLLETMHIDGRPILDLSRPDHRKIHEDFLGFNDIEYRTTILERTQKTARVVTDDNMVVEWRQPLRYP